MASTASRRRLIVNADDFGRSSEINEAVIAAHQRGILTTASLMVNGAAAAEAVELARQNPRLGVGLHLSLICGTSALTQAEIPGLVDANGNFSNNPVAAGFRYFASRTCRSQIAREIAAQFVRFQQTGLTMDHVNGHLHFHLHPTVFQILAAAAPDWGVRRVRVTREPFLLNTSLARRRWFYRISHAIIFNLLSRRAATELRRLDIRHTDRVFGLLQNGLVDESYVTGLLRRLPAGDSELYSHPSLHEFKNEFDALISPAARQAVEDGGIELIRYQDL